LVIVFVKNCQIGSPDLFLSQFGSDFFKSDSIWPLQLVFTNNVKVSVTRQFVVFKLLFKFNFF